MSKATNEWPLWPRRIALLKSQVTWCFPRKKLGSHLVCMGKAPNKWPLGPPFSPSLFLAFFGEAAAFSPFSSAFCGEATASLVSFPLGVIRWSGRLFFLLFGASPHSGCPPVLLLPPRRYSARRLPVYSSFFLALFGRAAAFSPLFLA